MSSSPQLRLVPANLPRDIPTMLTICFFAFKADPLSRALFPPQVGSDTEDLEEYLKHRIPRMTRKVMGKDHSRAQYAKIVVDEPNKHDDDKKMVGFAGWWTPNTMEDDPEYKAKAKAEKEAELGDVTGVADVDLLRRIEGLVESKSEELVGPKCDNRYWYLSGLAVHPDYQRLGIGSRLVKWGLEKAELEARRSPGTIDGAYTIATPAGLKTYLGCGMKAAGEYVHDLVTDTGTKSYKNVWLVTSFKKAESPRSKANRHQYAGMMSIVG